MEVDWDALDWQNVELGQIWHWADGVGEAQDLVRVVVVLLCWTIWAPENVVCILDWRWVEKRRPFWSWSGSHWILGKVVIDSSLVYWHSILRTQLWG